jgi:hypothetical protein
MMVANKTKILWAVIVLLMMLNLFAMTYGGVLLASSESDLNTLYICILVILPIAICFLVASAKQYNKLWVAAIPSTIQLVVWIIFGEIFLGYEFAGIAVFVAVYQFIPGVACVLLAYLCTFITKRIKDKR